LKYDHPLNSLLELSSKDHLRGFLQIEDEILSGQQYAFIISFDHFDSLIFIKCAAAIPDFTSLTTLPSIPHAAHLSELYLSASDQYPTHNQALMALLFTDEHV
jgi:hypothetical protein